MTFTTFLEGASCSGWFTAQQEKPNISRFFHFLKQFSLTILKHLRLLLDKIVGATFDFSGRLYSAAL